MGTGPAAVPAATPPVAQPSRRAVELGAVRRAARVTIAACAAFYTCQYLLGASVTALYAIFTVIALGALSDVQGTPGQRARAYLGAVAAGLLLITLGTFAAVSTWVAAAGMLVVGFAVAYSGVGGPRVTGVANGLQLFYVLPCFPPYAPDTLGQRLAGLVVGALLLAAADRWLWPAVPPAPPGIRLATAATRLAEYAAQLNEALRAPARSVGATELAARTAAAESAASLRLTQVPMAERPLGPGLRDRSLLAADNATRTAAARLATLGELLAAPGARAHPLSADLVAATGAAFAGMAAAVRRAADGAPGPPDASIRGSEALEAALKAYLDQRNRHIDALALPAELRIALTAVSAADEARKAVVATGGFLGAPPPRPEETPPALWFLHAGRVELWWRRLLGHLTPRSVYLQNAVRLALGLAVARVVAGSLDLSHGFWVLLATLSLMRTSAVAGRAALLRAFAGTVAGAIAAGTMLTLVGAHTWVYIWGLPPIMVVAFAAGPLFGVAASQASFTVVVAMLFAQLTPSDWHLAEVRLEDVLVGGLVGAVIGAAVWPRGGGGEIRRVAAAGLRAGATDIESTIGQLVSDSDQPPADVHRLAMLFDHTYAQFRAEPAPPGPDPDWFAVLGVVHRIDGYGTLLRDRHPPAAPLPWPKVAAALRAAAADVATAYRDAADAIASGRPLPTDAGDRCRSRFRTGEDVQGLRTTPSAVGRVLDGWGWLNGLADDLELLERAFAAPAAGARSETAH
jgi:uncharacterized membrane protein YccC